jgi:hypothetical protein
MRRRPASPGSPIDFNLTVPSFGPPPGKHETSGLARAIKESFSSRISLEKIDLQFQSCQSFALLKCRSVGDAHGCVSYVTKDTAMEYTHGIGMLFTGLQFNDCLPASDGREL